MRTARRLVPVVIAAVLATALGGCAPAPIYTTNGATQAVPAQVSQTPERYTNSPVVWGGRIVNVRNLSDHSEIELLAYPLDASQRPKANDAGNGRFIASVGGFADPMNFPQGALMTVSGRIQGTRSGQVGQASYVFPIVQAGQSHVWTADEMRKGHPNINFGVGVGVIR